MSETNKYRILYIEDDAEIAELCRTILTARGYEIETSPTAKDGLENLKTKPFDVVLLDYQLPDADGLRIARSLQKTSPDLPIVFITAKGNEGVAAEALSSGVSHYIVKNNMEVYSRLLPEVLRNTVAELESKR